MKLPPRWAEGVIWRFTAIFWFYRFRQSRYHQKTKNRLPPYGITAEKLPPDTLVLPPPPKSLPPKYENRLTPKNYRRMVLPPTAIYDTAYKVPPCLSDKKEGSAYLQSMDFQREPQSKHHLYFLDCFFFTSWPTRPNPTHIANANPDPHPS